MSSQSVPPLSQGNPRRNEQNDKNDSGYLSGIVKKHIISWKK
jgi:hypothetical protein